ncbi:MAG: PEP/pyruvate-binding domain-containing protein [Thermomicrobiales bacterium]
MEPMVEHGLVWLDGALTAPALLGGKGASLSRLATLGPAVPAAVALTTAVYHEALESRSAPNVGRASDVEIAAFRHAIIDGALSDRLRSAIRASFSALKDRTDSELSLAVRSSATAEDSAEHSFAGLHDTILGVRDLPSLEAAVRRCWASLWTDRAVAYRRERGVTDVSIAVVVQQMVRTDVSLVAFTADPVSGRLDRTIVNATWGLGEALVSGLVTPDHIVADHSGAVLDYQPGEKTTMVIAADQGTRIVGVPRALQRMPVLSAEQVARVVEVAQLVSAGLGFPVDIEAGFAGGELFLFQARPITTLGAFGVETETVAAVA